ncbi:hsp70 nucleotide exchange factor fes1 [Toensbergia leucococca]|nr:hsp70 nucleotide exchange factor fes1 [Toensbergia leucococca]
MSRCAVTQLLAYVSEERQLEQARGEGLRTGPFGREAAEAMKALFGSSKLWVSALPSMDVEEEVEEVEEEEMEEEMEVEEEEEEVKEEEVEVEEEEVEVEEVEVEGVEAEIEEERCGDRGGRESHERRV